MADAVKDNELDEETAVSAEPDFSPVAPVPVADEDTTDDDPHASFDPVVAAVPEEDAILDPYGVGAPKTHHSDDYEEEEESPETVDSEVF